MSKRNQLQVYAQFERYWTLDPATGCHNWIASTSNGYGRLKVRGRSCKAYRFALERIGVSIPEGAHVLHRCDNKRCVNPDHLQIANHHKNMRDRAERTYRPDGGSQAHRAKLTDYQVSRIRSLIAIGVTQKSAGALFGVTQGAVSLIARRKTWVR